MPAAYRLWVSNTHFLYLHCAWLSCIHLLKDIGQYCDVKIPVNRHSPSNRHKSKRQKNCSSKGCRATEHANYVGEQQ